MIWFVCAREDGSIFQACDAADAAEIALQAQALGCRTAIVEARPENLRAIAMDASGRIVPRAIEPEPVNARDVDAERDRRVDAGFAFRGKVIQARAEDRDNIAGAKSAAVDAKALGAMPGEYAWQQRLDPAGASVFVWITSDNSLMPLDVDGMIEMAIAAMLHKQRLIFAAKSLKDRLRGGEQIADITDSALWPA